MQLMKVPNVETKFNVYFERIKQQMFPHKHII